MKFENFIFEFENDAFGESGADSGGSSERFGVLGEDCFNGSSFGKGADESDGDFCATAFDFSEHFEKSTLAMVGESEESVLGFSDNEAGVEVDRFADDAMFDEDRMGDVDFVSDAVAIDDDWAGIGFEHFSS